MKKVLSLMLILAVVLTMASFPAVAAEPNAVETLGSTIRLADDEITGGIRFGATVDKEAVGIEGYWVYSEGADLEFGMYMLPAYKLAEGETLADYLEEGEQEALKIVAKKISSQDDDYITYTAVLINIPEDGYAKEIVAVPYVVKGETTNYYTEVKNSYIGVAEEAVNSYENGNPNGILPEQYEALKEIVGAGAEEPELTEQKVALTEANLTMNRIFDNGWVDTANFTNPANLFDGDYTTYSEWDQYKDDGTTADMLADFIIDLGAAKNLSKVVVSTGADDHFGPDWWSNAAPMNATISVSADGVEYTPVYTYDSDTAESQRVDSVELDYTTDGAGIQFVKYTFNKVARRATIAEIEIYEMAAGEAGGDEPGETPDEPEVPAEPAVITGITVTAENVEISNGRPLSNIVDGISGLTTWAEDYSNFIETTAYDTAGDGTSAIFSLTFDLGKEYNVSSFFFGKEWNGADISNAVLYGSNDDGATWTEVKSGIATAWGADFGGGNYYYTTLTNASYSMFKLDVTQLSAATSVRIHEIEFVGVPVTTGGGEDPEEPGVPAEPALITGITVTGEGITSMYPDTRPYSIICNGVSGEGQAIAWGDELFVSAETFAPGDGSAPLFTLTFDLGKEYDVSRFFVGIGWDTGDITAADLYGSNDGGATWTIVKSGMATAWSAGFDGGDMIGVDLTNASYGMFKLEVMNVSKEAVMQIHEIEFTGVPVA